MTKEMIQAETATLRTFSDSSADVWGRNGVNGYDWWYFDAISDNGEEAVRISFSTGNIFSGSKKKKNDKEQLEGEMEGIPIVSFSFYCGGRIKYSVTCPIDPDDFVPDADSSSCVFADSKFVFAAAEYGSGHSIEVNLPLVKDHKIEAHFEWLSVESDVEDDLDPQNECHYWNVVSPRSDVTGRITLLNGQGKAVDVFHFRGTGYHDHKGGNHPHNDSVTEWQYGRAHFADLTIAFCRYLPVGSDRHVSRCLTVSDEVADWHDAVSETLRFKKSDLGITYPKEVKIFVGENLKLSVKPTNYLASGPQGASLLSEMTLDRGKGIQTGTVGIFEIVKLPASRFKWLKWFR